ncbi:anion-transporting ATPase [Micractinium conductrix]|uniref:Anion-transporting ATPase n=1 Tax=Micractinium conductrix TaxID=554055 RepID=A0A2P6VL45_9CHLO|nr:anion-transporting ATPase [Micractinium conductrix]|eukprot:PSC74813.1 anion-transporting ATPase [Micractinium conductrix]
MAACVDADGLLEPTLQNVLDQQTLKWIFVGGKGGVGKTTCSCSLAVQLAAVRESVLIISTDPAHNLSDAFRQKFSKAPSLVSGFTNLYAMEVDPNPDLSEVEGLGLEDGGGSFLADISTSIPGIDEAMSFAEVMKQVQSMDYSCIVFDTAPTGHTLRLLQFPSTLEKGLNKLMSLKESFGGMVSQVSRMLGPQVPGGEDVVDSLLGKVDQLKRVVEEVNAQFKNDELTTFVCVCIPEFLSLYETERLIQELAKFEIDSRNIVINQVIFPEEVGTSRLLAARVHMQQKYLDQFYDLYEDFHIVKMPLLEEEVRGPEALQAFSENLVRPYHPPPHPASGGSNSLLEELQRQVAQQVQRIAELEAQLAAAKR